MNRCMHDEVEAIKHRNRPEIHITILLRSEKPALNQDDVYSRAARRLKILIAINLAIKNF